MGHAIHISATGHDEMGILATDWPVIYHLTGRFNRKLLGFQLVRQTVRLASQLRPDYVCCLTSEAALVVPICNRLKIPTLVYQAAPELPDFRRIGWSTLKRIRYKMGIFMQYLGARAAQRVVTISDFSASQANENWGIPREKLRTVGAGLEDVFFEAECRPIRVRAGLEPRFISVGRLTMKQKPLDVMATALKDLPFPWRSWTIVGSGPDESVLRKEIQRLGLEERTHFAGTLASAEIATLLDEHDIALLPSHFESFCLTVYEAAARKKIIITNDVADIRKHFRNHPSVVIVEKPTPAAYCQAIAYAIERFDGLQSTAAETADSVKRSYNWNAVAKRFLQALR